MDTEDYNRVNTLKHKFEVLFCSVSQYVAVRCSVLQCGALHCSVLLTCGYQSMDMQDYNRGNKLKHKFEVLCYNVLQCVAVRCSVLQCVAYTMQSHGHSRQ